MEFLLHLLQIYAAAAGIMALAAFGLLRRFGKWPSIGHIFLWCMLALFLISLLSMYARMFLAEATA
jgi:hypothetical protein